MFTPADADVALAEANNVFPPKQTKGSQLAIVEQEAFLIPK